MRSVAHWVSLAQAGFQSRGNLHEPLGDVNYLDRSHCRISFDPEAGPLPHVSCYPRNCSAGARQREEEGQHGNPQGVDRGGGHAQILILMPVSEQRSVSRLVRAYNRSTLCPGSPAPRPPHGSDVTGRL